MFLFLPITILFIFLNQYALTFISLPLKVYDNNETLDIITNSTIEENSFYKILYNPVYIGNPKQKILLVISTQEYGFYMFMKNKQFKPENDSLDYYNYDLENSSTKKIQILNTTTKYFYISDNFFFDSENGEEEVKDINIFCFTEQKNILDIFNSNVNTIIKAGLKLPASFDRVDYGLNLAVQLKTKNITSYFNTRIWILYVYER